VSPLSSRGGALHLALGTPYDERLSGLGHMSEAVEMRSVDPELPDFAVVYLVVAEHSSAVPYRASRPSSLRYRYQAHPERDQIEKNPHHSDCCCREPWMKGETEKKIKTSKFEEWNDRFQEMNGSQCNNRWNALNQIQRTSR